MFAENVIVALLTDDGPIGSDGKSGMAALRRPDCEAVTTWCSRMVGALLKSQYEAVVRVVRRI